MKTRDLPASITSKEADAIEAACGIFAQHGIQFNVPWEGDQDDLERERYNALVQACRTYHANL